MNKVYCSECVHSFHGHVCDQCSWNGFFDGSCGTAKCEDNWFCNKVMEKRITDNAIKHVEKEVPEFCEKANRNNDCKFFEAIEHKKKWWNR